jgi:hypothetical protein
VNTGQGGIPLVVALALLVVFAGVWMWRASSKKASGYYHL